MSNDSTPFFIIGNPRSGTSLLRSLLNINPAICIPPECGFLLWLYPSWKDHTWSMGSVPQFARQVFECRKFETWNLGIAELESTLLSKEIRTYAEAATSVYQAYASAHGKPDALVGDKNNYYITSVDAIAGIYPNSRFIHIVRDARDVACSYRELNRRKIESTYRPRLQDSPKAIGAEWLENNQKAEQDLEGKNCLFVRYEDMVRDTAAVINGIYSFLEAPIVHGITRSDHVKGMDEPDDFLQWKGKLNQPVDENSVGRYMHELSEQEIEEVVGIASPLLTKYGYLSSNSLLQK